MVDEYFFPAFFKKSLNNTTINIFLHICWGLYPMSKFLIKRFLGHRKHAFKIFIAVVKLFCTKGALINNPTKSV